MTTIQPTTQQAFWILEDSANGVTEVGELTGVQIGLPVAWGEGVDDYGKAVADTAQTFPPLPDVGEWLEIGQIFEYESKLLMVRQSHWRTHFAPEDTPALFMVFRQDSGQAMDWIAGEQVFIDTIRVYEGVEYKCTQAHVTQAGWEPPNVPALWAIVTDPTAEWGYPISYEIGDEVDYLGNVYRCLQAHTSQAGWTPTIVPALWEQL
jgi:hypothetical protein